MRTTIRHRAPLIALVSVITLSGCGAVTERAMETALNQIDGVDDVDIARDGDGFSFSSDQGSMTMDGATGEVTLETEDGTVRSGAATEAPDAITAQLDLPAEFEVTNATEVTDGAEGGRTTAVGGVLRGVTVDDALTRFVVVLEGAGLTIASRSASPGFANLATERPEGDTGIVVAVLLFADDDDTSVQLTLTER